MGNPSKMCYIESSMFKVFSENLLSFVFPLSCEICGEMLPAGEAKGVCENCRKSIPRIPAPHCPKCGRFSSEFAQDCQACRKDRFNFRRIYAAVYYDGHAKKLLRTLKFERRKILANTFLEILKEYAMENIPKRPWDEIVPVPMHRKGLFERGFNQADLLAKGVSKIFEKPLFCGVLVSDNRRLPQSKLGKTDRKENVQGVFSLARGADVAGKRILLVDDILTTGQTASQCAKVMKDAGAASVDVLVAARGL